MSARRPLRAVPSAPALPVFLLALAPVLSACAPDEAAPSRASAAIIGGAPTEGDPAVVLLASYPPDHSVVDFCTASVIAKDVLLTAAHCLDPDTHPGHSFGVFLGPDASPYETANTLIPELVPVKEVVIHPDYDPAPPFTADIGIVLLGGPLSIEPLPVRRAALDAGIVGQPARIVGYGQIKYQQLNTVRHEATTVVDSLGDADTVVVGDLDHRSCIGDSGGPALVTIDGVEQIIGVDSYTELSGCLEPAHYRRPDVYTSFLDVYAPPPGGSGGEGGSGGGGGGGGAESDGSGGCAVGQAEGRRPLGVLLLSFGLGVLLRRRRRPRA